MSKRAPVKMVIRHKKTGKTREIEVSFGGTFELDKHEDVDWQATQGFYWRWADDLQAQVERLTQENKRLRASGATVSGKLIESVMVGDDVITQLEQERDDESRAWRESDRRWVEVSQRVMGQRDEAHRQLAAVVERCKLAATWQDELARRLAEDILTVLADIPAAGAKLGRAEKLAEALRLIEQAPGQAKALAGAALSEWEGK